MTEHDKLRNGQEHVKAGNFHEAQACFEAVVKSSSILPEELANAKLLLAYTRYKTGMQHLRARKFREAATILGKVLDDQESLASFKERVKRLALFHVCALYEAAKQFRNEEQFEDAKKCFEAAKKTNKLPKELQAKNAEKLMFCDLMYWAEKIKQDSPEASKLLQDREFNAVAALINKNGWPKKHEAACLYEAGKQFCNDKKYDNAKKCFKASKKTNKLPEELRPKNAEKLMFCDLLVWAENQESSEVLNLLQENQFNSAATLAVKSDWPKKHQAACLYEAGKQHRGDGNLGEARRMFEAARKTRNLPHEVAEENEKHLCCKEKEVSVSEDEDEDGPNKEAISIEDWLISVDANYGAYADAFADYGYADSADVCDADPEDLEEAWDELGVKKKPHQKKILKGLQELKAPSKGVVMYTEGKIALRHGDYASAHELFEEARKNGKLPPNMGKRVQQYINMAKSLMKEFSNTKTIVFSDNCTYLLGTAVGTLAFSTTTLGLKTTALATTRPSNEMVMVLNQQFPPGSKKRGEFILLLQADMKKALKLVSNIYVMDLTKGSVVVHFCFANDEAVELEEEYLRQIDDKESPIYKGKVTSKIDKEHTHKMTMQLMNASRRALRPCPHQVGDTITLAQIQDEKIECKVDALLGEGATATVFKVTTSGKTCALKVFKAQNSLEDLCEEASLMLTANFPHSHPNVMRADFVWYKQRTNEMFFLMGLVDGGDLQAWMNNERLYAGTKAEQEARLILIVHRLACGLRHLHLRGILHEDFKPDNVLMTRRGVPVIGDLGVGNEGTIEDGMVQAMLRGGTPVYASPNVRNFFFQAKALPVAERKDFLQEHPITHLDDFFALGATILDMFAECGWRQGRSVAEVLASNSLAKLLEDEKLMRVQVPKGVVEVLQACFSADESLTVDSIVELTTKLCKHSTPSTGGGMAVGRCANIRNNLGVALFDSGMQKREENKNDESARSFKAAHAQLEHAIAAHRDDARTLNNLGVVKLTQGMVDEAQKCFDDALKADPGHREATFNRSQSSREGATVQLDRTGAAGAVDDSRGKVNLASALSFAPGQQLEVHRHGRWERIDAAEVSKAMDKSFLLFNQHPAERGGVRAVYYKIEQQLLVFWEGEWCIGSSKQHKSKADFEEEAKQAEAARQKKEEAEKKAADAENRELNAAARRKLLTQRNQHREAEERHRQQAEELASKHIIVLEGHGEVTMQLNPSNHAPALFSDLATIDRAQLAYTIELKDKHAFILDLFSGQQLSTRTQMASLRYREKERAEQMLSNDQDVDSEMHQRARKASTMQSSTHSVQATKILHEMFGRDDRANVRLRRYLLLILGPAASGKTTLLKTFMMETAHRYPDFVPILIPVIDITPVLSTCNHNEGESVVAAFIQRKYPQHIHLLLQMMLMRRAVFLIDGIDESGTHRKAVEEFVTIELLEAGHKTIITSRHSGFSSDAFKQCRLVELLPLSMEQQAEMVRTRVPDDSGAGRRRKRLVQELQSKTFEEIASNPLMLSMMISVYVDEGYKLISNRSELYETALRTLMGRSDKGRAGLDRASQAKLFEHLQKLASRSHRRKGERRIFTTAHAIEWAGHDGWSAIEKAMEQGRLPIVSSLGPNEKDEEEYRFAHLSYQEYLAGRQYYQQLTASNFSADTVAELFGDQPAEAFTYVKHHLMLQFLAGVLSAEQRETCFAVMCGGRVEVLPEVVRVGTGVLPRPTTAAAAVLAKVTVHGGEALTIARELGRAGAEALAPYVRGNTRLRTLVLAKTRLGSDGMRVLADALKARCVPPICLAVCHAHQHRIQASPASPLHLSTCCSVLPVACRCP